MSLIEHGLSNMGNLTSMKTIWKEWNWLIVGSLIGMSLGMTLPIKFDRDLRLVPDTWFGGWTCISRQGR